MSFRETTLSLIETLAWQEVASGGNPKAEKEVSKNFRAKLPEFKALEAAGFRKRHYSREFAGGQKVVIHFWQKGGERVKLKVVL